MLGFVEELEGEGIPDYSLDVQCEWQIFKALWKLISFLRKFRPHIVHSHMVHANILAWIVRLFVSVPVLISTARSIDERGRKGSGRLRSFLYRLTDPLCDFTTQVSCAGLERHVRIRAVPRHKIRYIPNGVDIERFCPNQVIRSYRLFICGDGPLRSFLEALTKELGMEGHVRFLGLRRDIPELMNAADGFVLSSLWEGMPIVLLEAHAVGLPIVATNVGGNREVVLNGKTGFLVPPEDPEALAHAMLQLMMLSQEERERMGQEERKHIVENFSMERVVDMWEALYYELLAQKG